MNHPSSTAPADLPAPSPLYVDAAEIARRYSVTSRHITALADSGDIPGLRVGRVWRFDPADVHAAFQRPFARKRPSQNRRAS
jgi:excisionase family DNA binding protein